MSLRSSCVLLASCVSAIATLQKLQEVLTLQRQKQQQKLLSHIQQLVAQNQQLSLPTSHHPHVARSAALQTNGAVDTATSASSASHVITSAPGVALLSPAALLGAASSSNIIAQQLLSLTSSAAQSLTSVANSHAQSRSSETVMSTVNTKALRVNTTLANENACAAGARTSADGTNSQSPGAESAGTPLVSPDLHLPDEVHNNGAELATPSEAPPDRARYAACIFTEFLSYDIKLG